MYVFSALFYVLSGIGWIWLKGKPEMRVEIIISCWNRIWRINCWIVKTVEILLCSCRENYSLVTAAPLKNYLLLAICLWLKLLLSIFSIDVTVLRKLPAYKTWQLIVETVPPNNGNIKSCVKSVELVMNQSEVLIVANWCRQLVYCVFCSPRSIKIIYLFLVKQ